MQDKSPDPTFPFKLLLKLILSAVDSQNRLLNSHAIQPEDMREEEVEVDVEVDDDIDEELLITIADPVVLPSLTVTVLLPPMMLLLLLLSILLF